VRQGVAVMLTHPFSAWHATGNGRTCLLVASAVMCEFARVMLACCGSVGMTWKGDVGGVTEIGGVEGKAE
jgi:hypothetical protein